MAQSLMRKSKWVEEGIHRGGHLEEPEWEEGDVDTREACQGVLGHRGVKPDIESHSPNGMKRTIWLGVPKPKQGRGHQCMWRQGGEALQCRELEAE